MTKRLPFGLLVAPCLMMLGVFAPAKASSVHYMSISQLVRRSDITLLGRAVHQVSRWHGTRIATHTEIEIEEVWAGETPKTRTISVVTPGGIIGDIGQRIDGAASLPQDGRIVVHLRGRDEIYAPVGMAQGVWFVDDAPHDAESEEATDNDEAAVSNHLRQAASAEGSTSNKDAADNVLVVQGHVDRLVVAQGVVPHKPPATLSALRALVLSAHESLDAP